jgi:hypothetical protein
MLSFNPHSLAETRNLPVIGRHGLGVATRREDLGGATDVTDNADMLAHERQGSNFNRK